ncbi:SAM-dependent methyltransferase, partial [Halorubrum pallidum]
MSTDDTTTETSTDTETSCGASDDSNAAETATDTESGSKCGASTSDAEADGGVTNAAGTATDADESTSTCGGSTSSSSSGCGSSKKSATDEKVGSTVDDFEADPGRLIAVGLGPGQPEGMTQRAHGALLDAEHIVGYTTYVELLPEEVTESAEELYDTPMCGEVSRTEEAIDRALAGNDVAIIGSGDPNVYALAGLTLEILESKGATASMVDFEVVPGVPAAQSCGARLGAPLVND